MSKGSGGASPVRGILKNKERRNTDAPSFQDQHDQQDQRRSTTDSGIQWDEMNILMTEHPEGKDYGHMKIEEPKTPYHETIPDENQGPSSSANTEQFFSPEDLAQKVKEASNKPQSSDDWEGDESSEEEVSEATKDHQHQFTEWRKKHYNEFYAVKRAKELLKQDEEELLVLEKTSMQDSAPMEDDDDSDETFHNPMDQGQS